MTREEKAVLGINVLFIVPGRNRGVQTYVDSLIFRLGKSANLEVKLFVSQSNRDHYADIPGVEIIECPVSGTNRVLRVLFEQILLQKIALRHGCEIMFFPGYLAPVRKTLPYVVTVPDTQFLDLETGLSIFFRKLYGWVVPRAVKVADRVITISRFSQSRIQHHLKIDEDKIRVIPLATNTAHENASGDFDDREAEMLASIFEDERPYLLSVSSSFKHKNIDFLVEAFQEFNQAGDFRLILVGVKRDDRDPNILSTGFVSNRARDKLYEQASGYVFASRYEGFGIPLLEAMAKEVPIASSTAGSLPEVGGEACLYFSPDNPAELMQAMKTLLTNKESAMKMVEKGRERLKAFSWDRTAEETEKVLLEVL